MRIAITGHRPHKLGNDYDLTSPLIKKIKSEIVSILIRQGILTDSKLMYHKKSEDMLITGMALGIDMLFAEIAVEYGIPFTAAIPFANQPDKWPPKTQTRYYRLLDKASEVVNVSKKVNYRPEYMQLRNIWMVDSCDLLIAVWDGSDGGTHNCVRYAVEKQREYIQINPQLIKL